MKKLLTAFAFTAVFASCNSNPKTNTGTTTLPALTTDTSGIKDNSLTDKGQVINMNGVSDTIVTANGQYAKIKPDTVAATGKTAVTVVETSKPVRHRPRTYSSSSTASNTPVTAPAEKKKGWSNAAKGAVIGAGTGAVAGAIVSKKKGTGAIVGGLLGAGGGYLIGKAKDKKKQKQ